MRDVNETLRRLSARAEGPIPFFCECGDDCCLRPVWLSVHEFDLARLQGSAFLAHRSERRLAA